MPFQVRATSGYMAITSAIVKACKVYRLRRGGRLSALGAVWTLSHYEGTSRPNLSPFDAVLQEKQPMLSFDSAPSAATTGPLSASLIRQRLRSTIFHTA
jgi:hypothetical protein